jgi:dTDP-4-dehydrorhamnose 3,5-epimerase
MEFIKTSIPDVVLIKPKIHEDYRGYFSETFRQDDLDEAIGYKVNFCQDNETKSKKGVLRGLHFQLPPFAQSKLVRVIEGEVLDVSVDIRQGSPTFGRYVAVPLSAKNKDQLFIPRGFAHGFLVLSEWVIFAYKVDNYYSSEYDSGLAFNDKVVGIDWGLPIDQLHLSDKDLNQPLLEMLSNECSQFNYKKSLYD